MLLVSDKWTGTASKEFVAPNPTGEDLSVAIKRLDGRQFTIATLVGNDQKSLTVGGDGGRYIVYVSLDEFHFLNLVSSVLVEPGVTLLHIGGQGGEYPNDQIVDAEAAIACALHFLHHQKPNPNYEWRS